MTRSLGFMCLFVAAVLLGCSSFNNSFNTYTVPPPAKTSSGARTILTTPDADLVDEPLPPNREAAVPAKSSAEHLPGSCPVSPWPEAGTPPAYPYQQMLAADGDLDQIERIERKHIDELRAYISDRRSKNRSARLEFEAKCVAIAKR